MIEKITNIPSLLCNTVEIKKISNEVACCQPAQEHFGNNSVTVGWLPLVNLVAGIKCLYFFFIKYIFFIVTVEKTKYMYP